SIETERPIVKWFYIINLQGAVAFIQVSQNFGSILKVVQNHTAGIMVHNAPSFLIPDSSGHGLIFIILETAGDYYTGPSQGLESERD
uniref:Si:dkey-238d18.6 n=1 Tax=Cyprinodon variegatus TaxID=28743 RepID=A0A3Q2E226_CYPVA